ncbi:insulin gene enhancer protein ISL-1-like isoform X2 [Clavelina lepadiformis]|uniref:insulin gene enhancer protein ISL-1-like isoform X2 n=1 Tax=Clavelina lepadiformis TaxID=159417 RepID=UPI004042AADF
MEENNFTNGCISATVNCDPCRIPLCVGCGCPIHDQYILRVPPNLEWHAGCLKCADCGQFLDETCTCFVREGKTYCKRDYTRLFGTKCNKCGMGFSKNDFVMRARDKIYHIQCFKCIACSRQLIPGDEFALRDDGLFCKADHEVVTAGEMSAGRRGGIHLPGYSPSAPQGVMSPNSMQGLHTPNGGSNGSSHRSNGSGKNRKDGKTTRVRTVLNEKQLQTLRTCYAANCRPDALMKEQLTEMTGLSARVIRVWFQNKRCKDKKRSLALKQMQEQQAKQQGNGDQSVSGNGSQSLSGMNGVPMVASEPVRNDSVNAKAVEVQNYQQPAWKALSDFALQTEIEQPAFQQLMNHFSDQGQGSISDSSEICSIPSVSSASMEASTTACSTPLTADTSASACS